jgi:RNA recognition motif-containing protein
MYEVVNNLQVSRDAETGISRGCGFVTMRSFAEARTAVNALDGIVSHTIAFVFRLVSSLLLAHFSTNEIVLWSNPFTYHVSLVGTGWA